VGPKLVWSNSQSSGVGKTHSRLRLSLAESLVVTADNKGKIFAFDQKTGALKWQTDTKAKITAGPTIAEGRVLVGTENSQLLAYQLADGKFSWKADLTGSVLAAPQGNRGMVFVHTLDGSVVALNADDGRQLWFYSAHLPPVMLRRGSSPALIDNHVIVGFANGRLVALHRMDGQPDWEREIAVSKGRSDIQRMVDISADPVVKNNTVYAVSYQGRLMALNADMGNPLWERDMSSYSGLAVTDRVVFVSDAKGVVWAIDRKSGRELWKQTDLTGRHLSAPAVIGNSVMVGDDDGILHWFAQEDGSWKGRTVVDSKGIEATPIVKDNRVYVLGKGGKMMVYEISDKLSIPSARGSH